MKGGVYRMLTLNVNERVIPLISNAIILNALIM